MATFLAGLVFLLVVLGEGEEGGGGEETDGGLEGVSFEVVETREGGATGRLDDRDPRRDRPQLLDEVRCSGRSLLPRPNDKP